MSRVLSALVGPSRVAPLTIAHGLQSCGDAFITVSLAGSLFFSLSPDASRQQVLLYLLVTLAPLAVLAPLIGPLVDRYRRRPQLVGVVCYLTRGVFCILLAFSLYQLSFYAYAVGLLVASRASSVVKTALVPLLTDDPDHLFANNARLARMSTIGGAVGAPLAAAVYALVDAAAVLRVGSLMFVFAAWSVSRLRPAPAERRSATATVEYVELHLPTVVVSSLGFSAIRGAVGFFVFTMAFTLRQASEPPWVYGAAIGVYGTGAFLGNVVPPLLRRHFKEQTIVVMAITAPAALALVGILGVSRPLLLGIAFLIGLSTTLGRHAFDAILQRRAPIATRGRAGARYETWFSLAFVGGAAIATVTTLPVQASMAVLSAIYLPVLVVFVRAFTNARTMELESGVAAMQLAELRLDAAEQRVRVGDLRTAVVEASAAVDLAQLADSSIGIRDERAELERLRRSALDDGAELADDMARRALDLARTLLSAGAARLTI